MAKLIEGSAAHSTWQRRTFLKGLFSIAAATAAASGADAQLLPRKVAALFNSVASIGAPASIGLSATGYAYTPTAQWHAGQSSFVMRADTTISGYISGTTFTAVSITGGAILEGMVLTCSDPSFVAGTKIVKVAQSGGGNGWTGNYVVSSSQTVGSAGTPVTFTIAATQVVSVSDLFSNYALTNGAGSGENGEGPRLMQDKLGRKFWRFIAPYNFNGSWLQNLSIPNLDSHNLAVIAVACVHQPINQSIFSIGAKANGSTITLPNLQVTDSGFVSTMGIITPDYNGGSPPANINKLFAGTQLQVLGSATATDDGVGGTSLTNVTRIAINEQSANVTNGNARTKGVTGMEVGKLSGQSPNIGNGNPRYAFIDLYELTIFATGQFGNRSQMPARFDAAMAAAQANFGIAAITDQIIFLGDSRSINGTAHQSSNGADGSGITIATLAGAPGSGIPAGTRVLNYAVTGKGIGTINSLLNRTASTANNSASPLSMLFGGGHDKIHIYSGINDINGLWPNDNYALTTASHATEMYGTDRTASFTATMTNNSNSLTAASVTGKLAIGSEISFTGAVPGLAIASGSASPYTVNVFQSPAVTGVAATGLLRSYKSVIETLLSRGCWVIVAAEPWYGTTQSAGTAQLRSLLTTQLLADVTADLGASAAARLRVYDLSLISDAGVLKLGSGYVGGNAANDTYVDGTHQTAKGKNTEFSGADTPQNGVLYNLLMAA